jgi:Fe2+ or Zn2+ uptake regulation protein
VEEFDSPLIAEARLRLQQEKGFDIFSVQLKMEGYCPKCKQKRKPS